MKKSFLLGAAAILACAIPGLASAQSGYAGASYRDGDIDGSDFNGWSVDGAAAFEMSGLGVQVGAHYGNDDLSGADIDSYGVEGHLYTRNGDWQWGGALAYNKLDSASNIGTVSVAGEVLYFMPRTTWSGVVSYSDVDSAGDPSSWRIDGGIRHFFTDNFSAGGGLGYGKFKGTGFDYDSMNYNAGVEYQFDAMPVSITAGYNRDSLDTPGGDVDTSFWSIGARWNFGGSLFERDRSGANLTSLRGPYERLFGS